MFESVVSKADFELIKQLPEDILTKFYLAGGTALALQISHRYSNDFDNAAKLKLPFYSFTKINSKAFVDFIKFFHSFLEYCQSDFSDSNQSRIIDNNYHIQIDHDPYTNNDHESNHL